MQPLNDDMEDLIRRAAKDYPLNTAGADWQKLQGQLHAEPVQKRRRRVALLALLIIPLSLVMHWWLNRQAEDFSGAAKPAIDNRVAAGAEKNNMNLPLVEKNDKPKLPQKLEMISAKQNQHSVVNKRKFAAGLAQKNMPASKSPAKPENVMQPGAEEVTTWLRPSNKALASILQGLKAHAAPPVASLHRLNLATGLPEQKSSVKEKRFYAGFTGGLDATTISFQKIEKTGFDFGLLAGYQLNSRLSVEVGLLSTKKFYYTKGEYFDKTGFSMPATWQIKEVEGNCRMLEFPLSLRYNFSGGTKAHWFATGGFRSYLMQEEEYNYNAIYSSGTTGWHAYSNKKSSGYIGASLSVSAGYQQPLGRVAQLRIEPYLQLPLQKMGTGRLKFTSAGLQIAVTKKLF